MVRIQSLICSLPCPTLEGVVLQICWWTIVKKDDVPVWNDSRSCCQQHSCLKPCSSHDFQKISRHHIQLFHPLELGRFLIPSFGTAFLLRYHRPILHAAWRIPALTTNKLPTVAIFRFPFREILNGAWITNGPHPKSYLFSSTPHFGGSCPVAILEDSPEER
ncbi:hypothetical protein CDAR_575051 [Caerostris darwini]|uniref:Uncharacterized protein n=1 Tax=Caerostris darwini TaxID=1538125 RepID=A0AAV4T011_9ARAC|nr:hypothetical protein CDAR_575051 [Caerostris darwini]